MWILTAEVNEYDQYGAYFVSCWLNKPTAEQLGPDAEHLLKGGGRKDVENTWFFLKECKEGVNY